MRYFAFGALALLGACLMAPLSFAQSGSPAEASKSNPPAAKAAPSGKLSVDEDVLLPLVGIPEKDFREARRQLKVGNKKAAAADIRAAASLIRLEAARPDAEDKDSLLSSAADLDKLAQSVEKGDVKSPSELNQTFAKADLALASHYHMMAKDELLRGNKSKALVWLTAATDYIKDSVSWSSRELKEGGAPLVKKMQDLGNKIAAGAKSATEATERGFDALGQEIKNLAAKVSQ